MRVIAGQHKGRRLFSPKGQIIRPTADRVKQFMFDVLAYEITAANVLDLFAGTGNLGIEALSRGAEHVVFVEVNRTAVTAIERNVELLHLNNRVSLIQSDVIAYIRRLEFTVNTFDLIFADPPYDYKELDPLIQAIAEKKLLNKNGCFVLEHRTTKRFTNTFSGLCVNRTRKLGNTSVSMFMNDCVDE